MFCSDAELDAGLLVSRNINNVYYNGLVNSRYQKHLLDIFKVDVIIKGQRITPDSSIYSLGGIESGFLKILKCDSLLSLLASFNISLTLFQFTDLFFLSINVCWLPG